MTTSATYDLETLKLRSTIYAIAQYSLKLGENIVASLWKALDPYMKLWT